MLTRQLSTLPATRHWWSLAPAALELLLRPRTGGGPVTATVVATAKAALTQVALQAVLRSGVQFLIKLVQLDDKTGNNKNSHRPDLITVREDSEVGGPSSVMPDALKTALWHSSMCRCTFLSGL